MSNFIDELLARTRLSSVVGKRVNWDSGKSRPSEGKYWACCPFHQEKTPSFQVNDQKGLYYCFGCQEGGNALTFIKKTQNVGSREAIQILANSVGLTVPSVLSGPIAIEESHKSLFDICEQAGRYFQISLNSNSGTHARNYLAERGVGAEAIKQFEIGFADGVSDSLTKNFINNGISIEKLELAGLSAIPNGGGAPYDRFKNRIIFPIRDVRGRMVGFGGRALSSSVRAKYLNSPETPIFKKRLCLYNHKLARESLNKDSDIILAEGYLDVIALWESGIKSCVATLGTAVAESHLNQLWKMKDEPVIALDGDNAGRNAALRTAKVAFPNLTPGKSLRFCFLPDGLDPDDFVRKFGEHSMLERFREALPLNQIIWNNELEGLTLDTPERWAAFESKIYATVRTIRDRLVSKQYNQEFRNRIYEMKWDLNNKNRKTSRYGPSSGPSQQTLNSLIVTSNDNSKIAIQKKEDIILGVCLTEPKIAVDYLGRLEELVMSNSENEEILNSIIDAIGEEKLGTKKFQEQIRRDFGSDTIDKILNSMSLQTLHRIIAKHKNNEDDILWRYRLILSEEIGKIEAKMAAENEIELAKNDAKEGLDRDSIKRIGEATQKLNQAHKGIDSSIIQETIEMENGVQVNIKDLNHTKQIIDKVAGLK